MRLSRRDAILALLAGGGAGIGAHVGSTPPPADWGRASRRPPDESSDRPMLAVAEVVYPSDVTATDEFVSTYVDGLESDRQRAIEATADALAEHTRRAYGEPFGGMTVAERDAVLRALGVDRIGSDPDGSLPERVRYHLVNQLLYALYTSPRGGQLVGIENPIGHPGGYESYQKPPDQGGGSG